MSTHNLEVSWKKGLPEYSEKPLYAWIAASEEWLLTGGHVFSHGITEPNVVPLLLALDYVPDTANMGCVLRRKAGDMPKMKWFYWGTVGNFRKWLVDRFDLLADW